MSPKSRSSEGAGRLTTAGEAGCGARARWLVTVALGRLGHHPADTRIGARGARWTGTGAAPVSCRGAARGLRPPVGAAVPDRTLRPSPRKRGPKLSPWDEESLGREPQWNADRRAAPRSSTSVGAAAPQGAEVADLRLSAFAAFALFGRRVSTVMDPVRHCRIDLTKVAIAASIVGTACTANSDANKNAPRERACLSAPVTMEKGTWLPHRSGLEMAGLA